MEIEFRHHCSRLIVGDVLEKLAELPDESVDCIVTSPPYWGLRDYGVDGQIGAEPTLEQFIEVLGNVFAECRRVLKPTGTLWVNMGDSYSASGETGGSGKQSTNKGSATKRDRRGGIHGIPNKCLLGQPWRLAFRLIDDGWILRADVIWHKPNPMPESAGDRVTRAHENIFMFCKSSKPTCWRNLETGDWVFGGKRPGEEWRRFDYYYDADAIRTPLSPETKTLSFETMDFGRRDKYKIGEKEKRKFPSGWGKGDEPRTAAEFSKGDRARTRYTETDPAQCRDMGANARSVWTIPVKGYPEAHFATFPEELPKQCIAAGCPPGGVVLDPFAGSGTTLAVASMLGRQSIGIELNPEYAELIKKRMAGTVPSLF